MIESLITLGVAVWAIGKIVGAVFFVLIVGFYCLVLIVDAIEVRRAKKRRSRLAKPA